MSQILILDSKYDTTYTSNKRFKFAMGEADKFFKSTKVTEITTTQRMSKPILEVSYETYAL
jgi:hypothetical protein